MTKLPPKTEGNLGTQLQVKLILLRLVGSQCF